MLVRTAVQGVFRSMPVRTPRRPLLPLRAGVRTEHGGILVHAAKSHALVLNATGL